MDVMRAVQCRRCGANPVAVVSRAGPVAVHAACCEACRRETASVPVLSERAIRLLEFVGVEVDFAWA